MMKKSAKDRRTFQVVVRMNKEERAELRLLAKRAGEAEAELLRRLVVEESKRCQSS